MSRHAICGREKQLFTVSANIRSRGGRRKRYRDMLESNIESREMQSSDLVCGRQTSLVVAVDLFFYLFYFGYNLLSILRPISFGLSFCELRDARSSRGNKPRLFPPVFSPSFSLIFFTVLAMNTARSPSVLGQDRSEIKSRSWSWSCRYSVIL